MIPNYLWKVYLKRRKALRIDIIIYDIMKAKTNKVHITTLGCSKNTYDSELLMGQLKEHDAQFVSSPQEADLLIINTCGFIAPAKQESIDAILEAERLKQADPHKKIVVCGCLSQRYGDDLRKEIPAIDGIFGTEDFQNILRFLNYNGSISPEYLYEKRQQLTPSHYAYLKISEGCNHTCSFCAIPLMRGKHRSRPLEHLIAEARLMADRGVKELILIAQDTTYYGLDLYGEQRLVQLLRELEKIEPLEWIRLHYLYPTTVKEDLLHAMANSAKIVPYLDMPIQHITDRMLRIMKRGGTGRRIRDIFDNARSILPDATLRTTLIVGHPGETDEDFQALREFVQEVRFDRLGVFTYSHEENTHAHRMDDLPQHIKERRYGKIMEIQQQIALEKNQALIGQISRVLIDQVDAESATASGRTAGDSPEIDNEVIVNFLDQEIKPGEFLNVRITDASEYDLFGKIEEN